MLNLAGTQIWPELDPDLGRTCFGKRQYSSMLPLLHHYLPVFNEICGTAMNFVFFIVRLTN